MVKKGLVFWIFSKLCIHSQFVPDIRLLSWALLRCFFSMMLLAAFKQQTKNDKLEKSASGLTCVFLTLCTFAFPS